MEYDAGGAGLTVVGSYRYDHQGRRIEFINSPPGGVTTTHRYHYDGPNMIAEYAYDGASLTGTRSYVHGSQVPLRENGSGPSLVRAPRWFGWESVWLFGSILPDPRTRHSLRREPHHTFDRADSILI